MVGLGKEKGANYRLKERVVLKTNGALRRATVRCFLVVSPASTWGVFISCLEKLHPRKAK